MSKTSIRIYVIRENANRCVKQLILLILIIDYHRMKGARVLVPKASLHFILHNEVIIFCKIK